MRPVVFAKMVCLSLALIVFTCIPMLNGQEHGILSGNTCTLTQITDTPVPTHNGGWISGTGTRIIVVSTANLSGSNSDQNAEIFRFDIPTGILTQITNTTGAGDIGLSLDANGNRIALLSNRNLTGQNADGNFEIFLFNATNGTITQVTHTSLPVVEAVGNASPFMSADGQQVVFTSSHDLTGNNPDENAEIFLFDISASAISQVTDTKGVTNGSPVSSAGATRIAFVSSADLVGKNPDGNLEIFLFERSTRTFTQITNTTGCFNTEPWISSGGTRLAFSSACDLTGNNTDANAELFLFDINTGLLAQITNTTGISPVGPFGLGPKISGNGNRITFISDRDLIGSNPDQNPELFLFDVRSSTFKQITNTSGFADFTTAPSISFNGKQIVFLSEFDLVGENADRNAEVFLATCGIGEP